MFSDYLDEASMEMDGVISSLKRDLATISTGRASPSLLDKVRVEVYGSNSPLSQVATVNAPDATTITIQVWDKGTVGAVEKAISDSGLGLTPMASGQLIRINIPKLSEERRKEFAKLAAKYGEDKKVAIRNYRHETLDKGKKLEGVSKDDIHNFEINVQKLTDDFNRKIDELVVEKERDIMNV